MHAPGVGRLVAGDDPEQRGLAGAVGAHEGHVLAVAHAEAHVLEQLDAAGRAARHPVHVDRAHGRWTLPTSRRRPGSTADRGLWSTVRSGGTAAVGGRVRGRGRRYARGTTGREGYGPGDAGRRAAGEPGVGDGGRRGRRRDRRGAVRAGRGDARRRRRHRRQAGRQALAPAGVRRRRRRDERVGVRRRAPSCWWSRSSRSTATPRRAVARRGWRPPARSTPSRSWRRWSTRLRELGATVATGRFRTDMAVELVNDGPVTLIVEV